VNAKAAEPCETYAYSLDEVQTMAMMSAMGISQQPWSVVREINHCSDQPNQRSQ
jgi:hypothetical protein